MCQTGYFVDNTNCTGQLTIALTIYLYIFSQTLMSVIKQMVAVNTYVTIVLGLTYVLVIQGIVCSYLMVTNVQVSHKVTSILINVDFRY